MKKVIKHITVYAMGLALAFSVMACGKKEIVIHEGDSNGTLNGAGGGSIETAAEITLPEGAKEAFEKAMETYTAKDFVPVGYLGSQVVAGINYKYLCSTVPTDEDPIGGLHVVVIYQDLDGKAEVTGDDMIDVSQYFQEGKAFAPEELAGGWLSTDAFGAGLSGDLKESFAKTAAEYKDITLEPIAPLDFIMGSSMRYFILCKGTVESGTGLCVAAFTDEIKGTDTIAYVNAFEY